jgi:hypothetical protein
MTSRAYHALQDAVRGTVTTKAQQEEAGNLRRAINAARRPSASLAADVGISVELLEDFRAGEALLTSDVIDRLVRTLDLKVSSERAKKS